MTKTENLKRLDNVMFNGVRYRIAAVCVGGDRLVIRNADTRLIVATSDVTKGWN
ncbi:MAG: hypothetical protein JWP57_4579 [Spirosoma sp.]|nr:hypothetical protein [Spirosoma sp.]